MVTASPSPDPLMSIEEVQDCLNRSRASIYRYANTDPQALNPPFNLRKLNAEFRQDHKDPLRFHPQEVARFARDVLRIKGVNVTVLNGPHNTTEALLKDMLAELRQIRLALTREPPDGNTTSTVGVTKPTFICAEANAAESDCTTVNHKP